MRKLGNMEEGCLRRNFFWLYTVCYFSCNVVGTKSLEYEAAMIIKDSNDIP